MTRAEAAERKAARIAAYIRDFGECPAWKLEYFDSLERLESAGPVKAPASEEEAIRRATLSLECAASGTRVTPQIEALKKRLEEIEQRETQVLAMAAE